MSKNEKLYTVGEVSKIVKIPSSALRFYDEHNLLSPKVRDADTGYRYYTGEQVMKASFISALKRINTPRNAIRDITASNKLINYRMAMVKRIAELEAERKKLQFKLEYAKELLKDVDMGLGCISQKHIQKKEDISIVIRYLPAHYAVTVNVHGNFYEQEKFVNVHETMYEICESNDFEITGPASVIFRDMGTAYITMEKYESDWMLPIKKPDVELSCIKYYDAVWCATLTHVGPYATLPEAYDCLISYIKNRGLEIIGPPMEEYLIESIHTTESSDYVTLVSMPIKIF